MAEEGLPFIVSPLHDMDVDPANGEVKKAHRHGIFVFKGNKSYSQITEICDKYGLCLPEICHSLQSQVRYMDEMADLIIRDKITELGDFDSLCRVRRNQQHYMNWCYTLRKNSGYIDKLIRTQNNKMIKEKKKKVDNALNVCCN